MSITPAFSPGPQITQGASVGSFLRWTRLDLYEQCSDHMTEKMPKLDQVRLAPQGMEHAVVFLIGKAVGGDDFGVILRISAWPALSLAPRGKLDSAPHHCEPPLAASA